MGKRWRPDKKQLAGYSVQMTIGLKLIKVVLKILVEILGTINMINMIGWLTQYDRAGANDWKLNGQKNNDWKSTHKWLKMFDHLSHKVTNDQNSTAGRSPKKELLNFFKYKTAYFGGICWQLNFKHLKQKRQLILLLPLEGSMTNNRKETGRAKVVCDAMPRFRLLVIANFNHLLYKVTNDWNSLGAILILSYFIFDHLLLLKKIF